MGWGGDGVSVCVGGFGGRGIMIGKKKKKYGMVEKHTIPNQLHII